MSADADAKYEAQLVHLAAGIPGEGTDSFAVVIINIPRDKKKEEIAEFLDENCGKTKSTWKVTAKRGPMKEHPFIFVNFEDEDGREAAMGLSELDGQDVTVIKRQPSIWVGGFKTDDDEDAVKERMEAAGIAPLAITKPAGKTWAYLAFESSSTAFESADTLNEAENADNEKGWHVSFPRSAKEKAAKRNRVAKTEDLDANKRKVFCYKLNDDATEDSLKEYFSKYGEIEELTKASGKSFAFVTYKKYAEAYAAASSEPEDFECGISKPDYRKKAEKKFGWGGGYGRGGGGGRWRGGGGGRRGGWGGGRGGWGGGRGGGGNKVWY